MNRPALRLCSCRGTKPGESPRPRCPIVLAWLDGKPHAEPRYICKLGLAYVPEAGDAPNPGADDD